MSAPSAPPPAGPIPFTPRLALGLFGVLMAAIMAGLNNRVGGLALVDVRGAMGMGADDGSWVNTAYAAGELAAMPFATWMAITFSLRRFLMWILGSVMALALILPFASTLDSLIALRGIQGLLAGSLIPCLMMSALRFLPPPIRLHGLALYALTATFAPNVAYWVTAQWVDHFADWRWVYWQAIPIAALAMACVGYGVPKMPLALPRIRHANWTGMALGLPGLVLLAITLDQGVRLEWWQSPLIRSTLTSGALLTALFLLSEWFHPQPFMKLQLLSRRNLGLGFTLFMLLLITLSSAVVLPANTLAHLHDFRPAQLAPLGLIVGLPQLVLGSVVALLLYQRWVDGRHLFALGLICISAACWLGARIDAEWMTDQLLWAQVLQAIGQPLAIVPLLFLATSVVQPMEGPSVSGIVNTLRALGTLCSGAAVGQFMSSRGTFHADMLVDALGQHGPSWATSPSLNSLSGLIAEQAAVLTAADVYRIFGTLALLMVPAVLCLQYIPAPQTQR